MCFSSFLAAFAGIFFLTVNVSTSLFLYTRYLLTSRVIGWEARSENSIDTNQKEFNVFNDITATTSSHFLAVLIILPAVLAHARCDTTEVMKKELRSRQDDIQQSACSRVFPERNLRNKKLTHTRSHIINKIKLVKITDNKSLWKPPDCWNTPTRSVQSSEVMHIDNGNKRTC